MRRGFGLASTRSRRRSRRKNESRPGTASQPYTERSISHSFAAAYARLLGAYARHGLQHAPFAQYGSFTAGLQPVVGLAAAAKQAAGGRDARATPPHQFRHCLAPCFFLIRMSNSRSAISIITSRASVSKRENDRAFSNSRMRLRSSAFSAL